MKTAFKNLPEICTSSFVRKPVSVIRRQKKQACPPQSVPVCISAKMKYSWEPWILSAAYHPASLLLYYDRCDHHYNSSETATASPPPSSAASVQHLSLALFLPFLFPFTREDQSKMVNRGGAVIREMGRRERGEKEVPAVKREEQMNGGRKKWHQDTSEEIKWTSLF